ncbi:MAG: excinuclease ABC subunit UvrC [Chloroflexi bacterium]|nr:excinuclease ABC subunit UvrC [Chloroflexota bacterium]
MNAPDQQSQLLPHKPGVYIFRDAKRTVLYVGKASNLHHRVRSYFTGQPSSEKIGRLVPRIADIDFIVTSSEQEALILENNLIKRHKPRFNVNLKDDKSYPYLKITLADEWPLIQFTRRLKEDGSRYFGPYAGAASLRQTMSLLNTLFPYRTCKQAINTGKPMRACLKYHIKRCAGPCIGAVSREEYRGIIEGVILFLSGKHEAVIRDLKKKMTGASANLEFERAAALRDQIEAIEKIAAEQKVVSSRKVNEDVIAIAQDKNMACAQVFSVRGGKLLGKEHFILEGTLDEDPAKVMASFIERFYSAGAEVPPDMLMETEPEDPALLETWLGEKRGGKVRLVVPQRGEKKQLVAMAAENAAECLQQFQAKWLADAGKTGMALEELKNELSLPRVPKRIECYDISNIRGTAAVGSMVVFEDGRPKSAHYRRFKIKAVEGIDDYAMMREVLKRRFAKGTGHPEGEDRKAWAILPDLVLIDGGRGHLNTALAAMHEMGAESVPVASIAKENEEVFIPDRPQSIFLPRTSQALYLLQRIRDEAHRFAISYHTRLRQKASLVSSLDQVPGIGPKRKRALLKRFGSVKGIRAASVKDLASVPGMTKELAERVREGF